MNELFSFTITVFESDEVSKDFKIWYEKIWAVDHPKLNDFTIGFTKEDGKEAIEVMSHNPNFPLTALFEIWLAESEKTRVFKEVESDYLAESKLKETSKLN